MLEVEKKYREFNTSDINNQDIIVTRKKKKTEETKEGTLTKIIKQEINITKKVNATKKAVIGNTMEEKLAKVRQALEEVK